MGQLIRGMIVLWLGLLLIGCRTEQTQDLVFETIQQGHHFAWEDPEPGLIVITTPVEAAAVESLFREQEAWAALNQVDFTTALAIIALRGWQPMAHGGFEIDHVTRQGRTIMLRASPGQRGGQPAETSPYHIIKIQKGEDWGKQLVFQLYFGEDSAVVASTTYSEYARQDNFFVSSLPTPTEANSGRGLFGPSDPIPAATSTLGPSETGYQALAYIEDHYGIPPDRLIIVGEGEQIFPTLGRTFGIFTMIEANVTSDNFREYTVMIDLATGEMTEDYNAIRDAEEAAYIEKYGKLEVALYDRLQTVSDKTILTVAVWATGNAETRTELDSFAILASEFPEAAEALANGTKPMDVDDPDLSNAIQARYDELRAVEIRDRIALVADWLRQEGYEPQLLEGMPSLAVDLPKEAILRLAELDTVAMVYFIK